jgi:hypothetical protein
LLDGKIQAYGLDAEPGNLFISFWPMGRDGGGVDEGLFKAVLGQPHELAEIEYAEAYTTRDVWLTQVLCFVSRPAVVFEHVTFPPHRAFLIGS